MLMTAQRFHENHVERWQNRARRHASNTHDVLIQQATFRNIYYTENKIENKV